MSKAQALNGNGASAWDMTEPGLAEHFASASVGETGMSVALLDEHADQVRDRVMSAHQRLSVMQPQQLREANAHLLHAALEAVGIAKIATREFGALTRSSRCDALTGLPDRVVMHDRLEQAVALARRRGGRLAVMFVDLDDFKQINDTLGHAAGDDALKLFAHRLSSMVRDADTVSRNGGDEFLVLLADVARPSDVTAVAASMLEALAEPAQVGGRPLVLSASLGVAIFPEDGEDADSLIARADAAMYVAKRAGGGSFRFCWDVQVPDPRSAPARNGDAREHALRERAAEYLSLRKANHRLETALRLAAEGEARARQARQRQVTMLASASDALRRPLEPIRKAVAMLEHAHEDEALLSRLQGIIEGQIARLSGLIEDLQDGGDENASNPGYERGTVDLLHILCFAVARSKPKLDARRQVLTREPLVDALRVHGDATRLGQAFSNLLDNASTHTPPGGAITLSATTHAETVTVTVTVPAPGFGLESGALIGNGTSPPRGGLANSRGSNGFAPGLAAVRDLVKAYGGTLAVSAAGAGHGSEVVVRLPKA